MLLSFTVGKGSITMAGLDLQLHHQGITGSYIILPWSIRLQQLMVKLKNDKIFEFESKEHGKVSRLHK
jgi:predicted P-loop ATPase/GTPase